MGVVMAEMSDSLDAFWAMEKDIDIAMIELAEFDIVVGSDLIEQEHDGMEIIDLTDDVLS